MARIFLAPFRRLDWQEAIVHAPRYNACSLNTALTMLPSSKALLLCAYNSPSVTCSDLLLLSVSISRVGSWTLLPDVYRTNPVLLQLESHHLGALLY